MAKTSGSIRSGEGGNFLAYASIRGQAGNSRIIEKNFRSSRSASKWLEKVSNKFSKGNFAEWGMVEGKRGNILQHRDFSKEFSMRDARAFRRGYK